MTPTSLGSFSVIQPTKTLDQEGVLGDGRQDTDAQEGEGTSSYRVLRRRTNNSNGDKVPGTVIAVGSCVERGSTFQQSRRFDGTCCCTAINRFQQDTIFDCEIGLFRTLHYFSVPRATAPLTSVHNTLHHEESTLQNGAGADTFFPLDAIDNQRNSGQHGRIDQDCITAIISYLSMAVPGDLQIDSQRSKAVIALKAKSLCTCVKETSFVALWLDGGVAVQVTAMPE